jgi:CRISPR-associated protein Cst2
LNEEDHRMSLHVYGAIVTHHGTAANNRAETEGNITTLQKLLWYGRVHSTVSAEAIRFALRRRLAEAEARGTNRRWDEDLRSNVWEDPTFESWAGKGGTYIDDDLLGFMSADAAKEENGEVTEGQPGGGKKGRAKGTAKVRRAVLEVTRAVSLTPFGGDVTFNAASPGATPSAQKKGSNPVPYGTEVHATRYQYGFALTPGRLREPGRAGTAVEALSALGEVAGNHGRFLYDFSPESAVFRVTHDPAPRLLYVFEEDARDRRKVSATALLARVKAGDIPSRELVIAGAYSQTAEAGALAELGATLEPGVRQAARLVCDRLKAGEG